MYDTFGIYLFRLARRCVFRDETRSYSLSVCHEFSRELGWAKFPPWNIYTHVLSKSFTLRRKIYLAEIALKVGQWLVKFSISLKVGLRVELRYNIRQECSYVNIRIISDVFRNTYTWIYRRWFSRIYSQG